MSKRVLVILASGFEEIEAVTQIDVLVRAGLEVSIASVGDLMVKGSRSIKICADIKIDDINPDFDACVLPGGAQGASNLSVSIKVSSLLKDMNHKGKLIAAICASPAIVLSPLGILKDKKATCYPGMQDRFSGDTTYIEKEVVVDGNIITSRGPATALWFGIAIVEALCGEEKAAGLKKELLLT